MTRLKQPNTLKYLLLCLLFFMAKLAHANVQKSPNDHREYLAFSLKNNLKVLVVSDPQAKKAAASMDVAVGSGADPAGRQGLAHFLEHMLFLGTEKYPTAGEYQEFIRSSGGNHNAYTSFDNTNYFFDVKAEQLPGALDRFSRFFIDPLFTEELVDRERHAVYSEYQSKLRDDGRRAYAVSKRALNPAHSYSNFSVGSLETLADRENSAVRDDLLKFYQRYYSSNLMALVVLGPQSTEELKQMVTSRFSDIPDFSAKKFVNSEPLFLKKQLPAQLNIKTIKDLRSLSLTFPVAAVRDHWRTKPLFYISSQIGYEGAGSLLSELKRRGWATGFSASTGHDLINDASFQVQIALTKSGMKHYQQVTSLFFEYVEMITAEGVNPALYEEERQLSDIRFRFQEGSEPMRYVGALARNLQRFPDKHVIDAGYRFERYDPAGIKSYLNAIQPENMLLTLMARDLETDRKEEWYGTKYSLKQLDQAAIASLTTTVAAKQLAARQANPFVAQDLALKSPSQPTDGPEVILRSEGVTLWHQQDSTYKIPKADFFFTVMTRQANASARNAALTSLYTRMVQEQLNETLYDAYVAGLSSKIYPHLRGFSVRISGYNDKLDRLLQDVISGLKQPEFDQQRFADIRQQYIRSLKNSRRDKPYNQTINEIFQLLLPEWSEEDKLSVAENLTLEDLKAFVPQLLAETELRLLAHGNLQQQDAVELAQVVSGTLFEGARPARAEETPVVRLQKARNLVQTLEVDHNDSAISVYFQGDDTSLDTRAKYALLSELMASPFYNRLRTEKQLGYVVFETPLQLRRAPGLAFVVQSPVAAPTELEKHINGFISGMQAQLDELDEQQLERYKQSVVSRVMKRENTLTERSARYWREIDRDQANFNSREELAAAVQALSLADIKRSFREMDQRRLTVRSFGNKHLAEADQQEIARRCDADIQALKVAGEFMPEA
ncbi:insulinase family protein [Marinobacterium jannaschii]|uniref:insulinase family protein n=1 Tax=Marinobacterium jannaschii TaxID=64970 RepID=UPI000688DE0D|nr:insulinase family protein [Marinobacterium jannaschii]